MYSCIIPSQIVILHLFQLNVNIVSILVHNKINFNDKLEKYLFRRQNTLRKFKQNDFQSNQLKFTKEIV